MSTTTVLVVGATGAIGSATAAALAERGVKLILAGRRPAALADLAQRTGGDVLPLDLSDLASIRSAAARLRAEQRLLHGVVHAAAVFRPSRVEVGGFEEMFLVNQLGPFLLTRELAPLMRAASPARMVMVGAPTTAIPDLEDLQSRRWFSALRTFERTRMANLAFTFAFARREASHGISAFVVYPGRIRSGLMDGSRWRAWTARWGAGAPEAAAQGIAHVLLDPGWEERSAAFLHGTTELATPAYARDYVQQERLWTACERLLVG